MNTVPGRSWGGYPQVTAQTVVAQHWRGDPLPSAERTTGSLLPFGNGRSYGDSCLNAGGTLIYTRPLDRFIAFDAEQGVLRCEAGVLLEEILALVVPRGWFLAATPGTQLVTLGGAIANDVHGKNQHRFGTFGHHVQCLELLRSDGTRLLCSRDAHPELFRATIGGLGLTGLITWAEIRLRPVAGPYIEQELLPFANLDELFALLDETDRRYEATVSWIDCAASGASLGRGVLMGGDHSDAPADAHAAKSPKGLTFPVTPPFSLVTSASLKAFNELYYRVKRRQAGHTRIHYRPFFYPLDAIDQWNRLYGKPGFMQYQCVIPRSQSAALREMLERIARAGAGSFLAVLKLFGDIPPAGMLSFPREGYTLALDFPNHGERTLALLESLDGVTRQAGGAVYPAKDARMSAASFDAYYPQWRDFAAHIDPRFSSSFWRRVTNTADNG